MIRSRRPAAAGLPAAVFAAALALVPSLALAASATGTYSLSGSRVHVYNLAGAVEIVAGSGSAVTVECTTGGRDAAKLDVQAFGGSEPALIVKYPGTRVIYRPTGSKHRSRTNLEVGADGRFGMGWSKGKLGAGRRVVEIRSDGSGLEAWADLRVAIPRGQQAALHLGVGAVTVTNVDGELLVDCAAARVSAAGTRGALRVDTGSGAVDVSRATGRVAIDTGSGSVAVDDFTGSDLSVDTGSGRVEIADVDAPRVAVDTGSGSVFVRLAGSPREVAVDTGSGSVTVEAPPTLDATIHMETGSGGLEVDFPMRSVSRQSDQINGTIGKGTGRVMLETGSGRIRLVKA